MTHDSIRMRGGTNQREFRAFGLGEALLSIPKNIDEMSNSYENAMLTQ